MLRKARTFANAARDELRSELGPDYADLELRDLDPRTIVRRHIVEAMEEPSARGRPPPGRSARGPAPARLPVEIPPYDAESDLTDHGLADRLSRRDAATARLSRSANGNSSSLRVGPGGLDEVLAHAGQYDVVPAAVDPVHHARVPGVGDPAQRRAEAEPGDR